MTIAQQTKHEKHEYRVKTDMHLPLDIAKGKKTKNFILEAITCQFG